jgi:hypothetical protein
MEATTMAKKETKTAKGGKKTLKGSSKLSNTKLMHGIGNT